MAPGLAVPPLACGSFAWRMSDGGVDSVVHGARETLELITHYLKDPKVILVGHNIAFDLAVVCAERPELINVVFQAYADDRIRDTDMRERLMAIAHGEFAEDRDLAYNLETLAKKRLKLQLDKTTHRFGYGKLIGQDLEFWPDGYENYAREDAIATLRVYYSQAEECDDYVTPHPVHAVWHEHHVCRKAWALMLMRAHGVRVDADRVKALETSLLTKERALMQSLVASGVLEKTPKKDTFTAKKKILQARVEAAYRQLGKYAPKTDPSSRFPDGQVKTDSETCEDSGDLILETYADYVGVDKILGTFLRPLLEAGGRPINAWWNPQLVSDRTSCSGPNFQNPPRADGVRQCIIPGPGQVFSSTDYATIELLALADFNEGQFGRSAMAERIREGVDLHTALAAVLLNMNYATAKANKSRPDVKNARNLAKAINFGNPGGLGAPKFVQMSKKGYGLIFSEDEARSYKKVYLRENPEMVRFFQYVSQLCAGGYGVVKTPGSGMIRGGCTYTAACNQHFQGTVAYGATDALFYVSWECYVDRGTVLFGSRPTLFVHDEIIAAHPTGKAAAGALRVQAIMEERMARVLTRVPPKAEPCLMERWEKNAEPAFKNGELIPWQRPDLTVVNKAA